MKYVVRAGVAAAVGLAMAGVALATPIELSAVSGTGPGTSILLPNTGGGGRVTYSNSDLNGWNIELAYGMSNSPAVGLSLITATADGSIAACDPLTIAVSDIGFTAPVGPGGLGTSLTNENISVPGSGTPGGSSMVTQWAYMDTGNGYFGSTDPNAASDFGGVHDSTASLIGMLTVDNLGSMSAQGGTATDGPYSLTLVDQFCSDPAGADGTCSSGLSVQAPGGITAPEPGGLALFGAGLLGMALFAGRRRSLKASF
jgi:hypothetical protein